MVGDIIHKMEQKNMIANVEKYDCKSSNVSEMKPNSGNSNNYNNNDDFDEYGNPHED